MIPLIPIVLAVAGLASGVASGISNMKNANESAKAVERQALAQVNERAKQARFLMSKQKSSFLKGGVYFEGTPEAVINETYDTAQMDINDIIKDANAQSSSYRRQGKTAFFSSLLGGIMQGAMGYAGASNLMGSSAKVDMGSLFKNAGTKLTNSKAGTSIANWYNSKRGWTIGDGYSNTDNIV